MSHGHGFGRGVGRARRNPRAEQGGGGAANLLLWSEEFDRAEWVKTGTVTAGADMDPLGGGTTADLASVSVIGQTTTTPGVEASGLIDLTVTDAWDRYSISSGGYTFSFYARWAAQLSYTLYAQISSSGGFQTVAIRDLDEGGEFYLWGAQLEAGAVATAYVKREGT